MYTLTEIVDGVGQVAAPTVYGMHITIETTTSSKWLIYEIA